MATIWTIGHSTRSLEEFLELLRANHIETVADVRRYPGSRKFPHFGRDALREALAAAGIGYEHFVELGGRRKARPDSPNTAWRSEAFRGYADFMMTTEFDSAIRKLVDLAERRRTAILCSEAVWWRCHRGLVSDWLKADGHDVLHITGRAVPEPHPYTSAASIAGGRLSYSGVASADAGE
ncbi:MAG TPA: DUF488 domain-containing protein [Candidatus Limnocylindrales bacterium]|nr:DUF488 domain-containing protein [Candidatus Limnocylindrales bacterium]